VQSGEGGTTIVAEVPARSARPEPA
jgi:two-component system NarL family sensor kinase